MPGAGGALALDAGQAAGGGRLRHAQPARLVRRPGRRGLLHRQPGRLGRDQQALPRRRRASSTAGRTAARRSTPRSRPARRRSGCRTRWARSINGVTYDNTGGKFGPFAGQFFMAELMYGGAIIRANVEKVNGVYQGACFPFWGKGLLGPVYAGVRSARQALRRRHHRAGLDGAAGPRGAVPHRLHRRRCRSRCSRSTSGRAASAIVFTTPVDREDRASRPTSYQLEHYRYEYTGAYGSPELDRTSGEGRARWKCRADGKSVELTTAPLVKDRVYMLSANGVRSAKGEELVHPTGAYTLNEVPAK